LLCNEALQQAMQMLSERVLLDVLGWERGWARRYW
jgi:hypothetical protein